MITEIVSGAKWTFKRKRSFRQFVSCECLECKAICDYAGRDWDGTNQPLYQCPDCKKLYPEPQPKWVRELDSK